MDQYLEPEDAAAYVGLSTDYLMRQCRKHVGPVHFMPSPKKTLFSKPDLDAWVASWVRREPQMCR